MHIFFDRALFSVNFSPPPQTHLGAEMPRPALFAVLLIALLATPSILATVSSEGQEFQDAHRHLGRLRSADDVAEDCVGQRVSVRGIELPVECLYHDGTYVLYSTVTQGTVIKGFGITYESSLKSFVGAALEFMDRKGIRDTEEGDGSTAEADVVDRGL